MWRSGKMGSIVLTEHVVSVSELKSNPKKAMSSGNGAPVAVLNHNKPEFYCVPTELFESLACLLYTSPSPRDGLLSRMPSSA